MWKNILFFAFILKLNFFICIQAEWYTIDDGGMHRISPLLKRMKRDWVLVTQPIPETIEGTSFVPSVITTIRNDNPAVKSYALLSGSIGVDEGYFEIETIVATGVDGGISGEIKQMRGIDREMNPYFEIQAIALDISGNKVDKETDIFYSILDYNDNKPIFVESTLTGSVAENANPGYQFLTVQATDADEVGNNFGVVHYEYAGNEIPPTDTPRFSVNQVGQVSIVNSLNRETVDKITFTVLGKDGVPGGAGYITTATVTVNILDVNDNAPYFSQPVYSANPGELKPVGSSIVTVQANDDDEGKNKAVYFDIIAGNEQDIFAITNEPNFDDGPSTGTVTLKQPLDFETVPSYTLTVRAYNRDADSDQNTRTATATVSITVLDENEPPVFTNTPYAANVPENMNEVIENVVTVSAFDYDYNGAQQSDITYDIVNNQLNWFTIVPQTGVISTLNSLDREHVVVDQDTSQYIIYVTATDHYSPMPATATTSVVITIGDKNDNAPEKGDGWIARVCETPSEQMKQNVTEITVVDKDSSIFEPFEMAIIEQPTPGMFHLEIDASSTSAKVVTVVNSFDIDTTSVYEIPIRLSDHAAQNQPSLTSTETLTVSICRCSENYELDCATVDPAVGGFPTAVLIAIIAAILIILIIILAVVAYRRRNTSELEKQSLFYDEDDVRENLQAYHEEGGEEDNNAYDISTLQNPPPIDPKRQDVTPLKSAQPQPRRLPPDTDIGDYINDAKQQADSDPTAPPFDSILVFDNEGNGSDAGSLSSLNSGTTDASQDYDYLNDWGPRFKKLADMYGGGEED